MTDSTRRTLAILASAALTASLATATLASDVDAAKRKPVVKCDGKVATKVGTKRPDVIRGTARKDVIAGLGGNDIILGRGGNDTICGGAGNDRLVGGPGHDKLLGQTGRDRLFGGSGVDKLFGGQQNDFLAGQDGPDVLGGGAGSDRLDGGIGVDLCSQGTGHGPMVRCELPRAVFAPPAPPAPTGPTPEPKTLAIAYSDLVRDHQYGIGDVMISQLLDTNGDGVPSTGDTIKMGAYPTTFDPSPSDFAEWGVTSHLVDLVQQRPGWLQVESYEFGHHEWRTTADSDAETYVERRLESESWIEDGHGSEWPTYDRVRLDIGTVGNPQDPGSPSRPTSAHNELTWEGMGDDPFIDVELSYGSSVL